MRTTAMAAAVIAGTLAAIGAALAVGVPTPPIDAMKIDAAALERFGTREYRIVVKRANDSKPRPFGVMRYQTTVAGGVAKFDDALMMPTRRGDAEALGVGQTVGVAGGLPVSRIEVRDAMRGDPAIGEVAGGRVTFKDAARVGQDWPAGTVTEAALLRIVTAMPRNEGGRWRIAHFIADVDSLADRGPHELAVSGRRKAPLGGQLVDTTRITLTAEGAADPLYIFDVDDSGVLVRILYMPGLELTLITPPPPLGMIDGDKLDGDLRTLLRAWPNLSPNARREILRFVEMQLSGEGE